MFTEERLSQEEYNTLLLALKNVIIQHSRCIGVYDKETCELLKNVYDIDIPDAMFDTVIMALDNLEIVAESLENSTTADVCNLLKKKFRKGTLKSNQQKEYDVQ